MKLPLLKFTNCTLLLLVIVACSQDSGAISNDVNVDLPSTSGNSNPTPDSSGTNSTESQNENSNEDSASNKVEDVEITKEHPRLLVTKSELDTVLSRAYGPNAVSPYKEWFSTLKSNIDGGKDFNLQALALLYLATQDEIYFDKLMKVRPTTGAPKLSELAALDLVYDKLPDSVFKNVMDRVASTGDNAFIYSGLAESRGEANLDWGYHTAYYMQNALAYSLFIADHPLEINKNSELYPFDARNFLQIAKQQLEPGGDFYNIERRFAGDMTYNSALPGELGGVYDNFSYDQSEESFSAMLYFLWYNATGSQAYMDALRDKHRARLYLTMGLPFTEQVSKVNSYCQREGTISAKLPKIWDTSTPPKLDVRAEIKAFVAKLFQDPYSQWFVENGSWLPNCGSTGLVNYLLHYDAGLAPANRESLPTSSYYSGSGLVVMRTNWQKDAAYGLFTNGEAVSRRYPDANSFMIHRNDFIIKPAGVRTKGNHINEVHHWYARQSFSKNIVKVLDPDESFDFNADGSKAEPYSGVPLVASDNYGGQSTIDRISTTDGCYINCYSNTRRGNSGYMFKAVERGDITKYEHVEGEYTYSVGDATASYSGKVEYIDREFLFIHPDVFLIFDRVKVTDPEFKKVWTIHTVAKPVITGADTPAVWGKTSLENGSDVTISQEQNITYLKVLHPRNNEITVRGGDTEFIKQKPLSDIESVELDIPRWLEIYANGDDLDGSITIRGSTKDAESDTEEVVFDGRQKVYLQSQEHQISGGQIKIEGSNWKDNQWAGYRVSSGDIDGVIHANTKDTLIGDWTEKGSWLLTIYKPLANTSKYWKRIDSVSTNDMDIENITLSVPHYFDTEDVSGRLHTFAPQTDYKSFGYKWDPNNGQFSMEVEAKEVGLLQHFVHTISLKDPGKSKPIIGSSQTNNTFNVRVDDTLFIFAKTREPLTEVAIDLPSSTKLVRIFNLQQQTDYFSSIDTDRAPRRVTLSSVKTEGQRMTSSEMGVVSVNIPK